MEECYFQSNRRLKPIKIHSGTLLGIGIFHFLRTHYLPCIRGYKILAFRRILRSYSKQLSGSLENSGQPVTWNQGKPGNIKEKKWSEESRKSQCFIFFQKPQKITFSAVWLKEHTKFLFIVESALSKKVALWKLN